jgi:hypothetical protein
VSHHTEGITKRFYSHTADSTALRGSGVNPSYENSKTSVSDLGFPRQENEDYQRSAEPKASTFTSDLRMEAANSFETLLII